MSERCLVLIGGLAATDRDRVRDFALRLGAPVYAEPLSGLREDHGLQHLLLQNERILAKGQFTRVIRLGNVPTVRFWRDLDESLRHIAVESYSPLPFAGLCRGEVRTLDEIPETPWHCERDNELFKRDRAATQQLARILDDEPHSELAMFRQVSRQLPPNARLYLGNSLPIREWDIAAERGQRGLTIEANRGANGIDGQLSTFFGWCASGASNHAIIGDLTALYDLNAPWIVPQLDPAVRFQIFIINNRGGRIFSRVASLNRMSDSARERLIENVHDITFESWAAMWNLAYNDPAAPRSVIEMRPDEAASRRVWDRYDELWR